MGSDKNHDVLIPSARLINFNHSQKLSDCLRAAGLRSIGRKARTAEDGVFIPKGYAVLNGAVSHACCEGKSPGVVFYNFSNGLLKNGQRIYNALALTDAVNGGYI